MATPCDYQVYLGLYKEVFRRFPGNRDTPIEQINQMARIDYERALGHLSEKQIDFMFTLVLQKCKFWPMPAEMLDLFPKTVVQDPKEETLLWAQNVARRLMIHSDGRPYTREVLDEDPDIRAVFHDMGGGSILDYGFGRWPKRSDRYKEREFIEKLVHKKLDRMGLNRAQSQKFLLDSGLGEIIGPKDIEPLD